MEFQQPNATGDNDQSAAGSMNPVDSKIMADLTTVTEKMDLLDSMLKPGADSPAPSVKNHEALLTVIGFLEACAPRMVELVEAAAQGALSGNVLEYCLQVNDRLLKQLTDIDTLVLTESAASTTAASAPPPVHEMNDLFLNEGGNHDDDDDDDDDDAFAKKPPAATKSSGLDEDDGIFRESKPAGSGGVEKKDSFDDFFEERVASGKTED